MGPRFVSRGFATRVRRPAALCGACAAGIVAAVEPLVGQRPSEGRPVR